MSAWPIIGDGPGHWSWHKAKLAMAVAGKNRHYALKDIQRRHFDAMAAKCGYGESAEGLIESILARVPAAIEAVQARLPAGFPDRVASPVFAGLQESAGKLRQMPAS
jgi:serine/threonine-protein kinase HipA